MASHTAQTDDYQLFLRLKSDPVAIGEAYDRYAEKLFAFVLKRCGHKETAEDIVSQSFVKLIEQAPKLEWKQVSLGAWLYHVASNLLIDLSRKASTKRDVELDTDVFDPPSADDPAWNAEIAFDGAKLREVLKRLSERDQQVLDLRFYGGYEVTEIAELLEVSANHASVLVYRALGRLRKTYLATV